MAKIRTAWALAVWAAISTLAGASPLLYLTPDVPTREAGGTEMMPWQVFAYDAAGAIYTLELTVPGEPHLDAIHKLDSSAEWLFSVESPNDLASALTSAALPSDVIRRDAVGNYSLFFCGGALGLPTEVNLDALYLAGGDAGNLIVSFDVPLELPVGSGTFYDPADLLSFSPTGGGGCSGWSHSGLAFDASVTGTGIAISDNLVAADFRAGLVIAMDAPSDLAPSSGPAMYVPGEIASWNGVTFGLFASLAGWPAGSVVDGLSCQANPGRVDATIGPLLLGKASGNQLTLSWSASCSSGAEDYGIYEGTIASVGAGVYDHVRIDCTDAPPFLTETITPGTGSRYYLVVPNNSNEEGSYGVTSVPASERPQAPTPANRCRSAQNLTACP